MRLFVLDTDGNEIGYADRPNLDPGVGSSNTVTPTQGHWDFTVTKGTPNGFYRAWSFSPWPHY